MSGKYRGSQKSLRVRFEKIGEEQLEIADGGASVGMSVSRTFESIQNEISKNLEKLKELNKRNRKLMASYKDDKKYVRVHKRIQERNKERKEKRLNSVISENDEKMINILSVIKTNIDNTIEQNINNKNSENYFKRIIKQNVAREMKKLDNCIPDDVIFVSDNIYNQYVGI